MREQDSVPDSQTPSRRSIPPGVAAGLAAVVIAAAGGVAWWTWQSHQSQSIAPETATQSPTVQSPADLSQVPIQQNVQVYWLKSVGDRFEISPATVSVAAAGQPDALLKAALEEMLKGDPNATDLTSTIPQGTQLRQVKIQDDGVHVDLSQDFTTGGGSASMTGRLGQIIYTATTLDSNAAVWLSVEGKPLEVLGGEGLLVDQPMTRASFEQNFKL